MTGKVKYKLWFEIEKITDPGGHDEDYESLENESVGVKEFDTLQEARDHIDTLMR